MLQIAGLKDEYIGNEAGFFVSLHARMLMVDGAFSYIQMLNFVN